MDSAGGIRRVTGRENLIRAAELWLGTPYHHAARCYGAGVDCVNLLCAVYQEAGLTPHIELPHYPPDWMMHRGEEWFMMGLLEACLHQVDHPEPGDVALFRFGRCYSHGAIVTQWPQLIHAFSGLGVVRGDARNHPLLDKMGKPRETKFYSVL
jgi:cell wall-associated NlpC family hydrolase